MTKGDARSRSRMATERNKLERREKLGIKDLLKDVMARVNAGWASGGFRDTVDRTGFWAHITVWSEGVDVDTLVVLPPGYKLVWLDDREGNLPETPAIAYVGIMAEGDYPPI